MSFFPQLHKPSANPVDATSIADPRFIPVSLFLLLSSVTALPPQPRVRLRAAEHLTAQPSSSPLHDAAGITFERRDPLMPPLSSESSQRFSLYTQENPSSFQRPRRPGLTPSPTTLLAPPIPVHQPLSTHADPKPAPPSGPLFLLFSGMFFPRLCKATPFHHPGQMPLAQGQCFLTPSQKVAQLPITVTSH